MLSQVMQDAINEQVNNELFSSYTYLSMAAWCEHNQFVGCAHWLRMQSEEERGHAMRLQDFLLARNCRVMLRTIAQPEHDFETFDPTKTDAPRPGRHLLARARRPGELSHRASARFDRGSEVGSAVCIIRGFGVAGIHTDSRQHAHPAGGSDPARTQRSHLR